MARIRSFAAPHKGLRHLLATFALGLGQLDMADAGQRTRLKEVGRDLFTLLKDHVHTENEHTLTWLDERAPGASEHDRYDHERLEHVQQKLEHQLSALTGNESPDELHLLYLAFTQFQSQYLDHIYEEETVTELALQRNFTDEELIQNRASVMQRFDVSLLLLWLKYIIPAQRDQENVAMLSGLKAHTPKAVMDRVMTTIRDELDAERFERITLTLQDQNA